jgi:hypothetical protein
LGKEDFAKNENISITYSHPPWLISSGRSKPDLAPKESFENEILRARVM